MADVITGDTSSFEPALATAALNVAGVGMFRISAEHKLALDNVSLAVLGHDGFTVPEDAGAWLGSIVHPDDDSSLGQDRPALHGGDVETTTRTFRVQGGDGAYRWVRSIATRQGGSVLGTLQNVTVHQQMAARLEQLESFIDLVPAVLLIKDCDLRYVVSNPMETWARYTCLTLPGGRCAQSSGCVTGTSTRSLLLSRKRLTSMCLRLVSRARIWSPTHWITATSTST